MELGKSPFEVSINFRDIAKAFGGWALDKVKGLATQPLATHGDHFQHNPKEPLDTLEWLGSYAEVSDEVYTGEPTLRMRRSAIQAELDGVPEVNPATQPLVIQPRHGTFKGW